MEEVIKKSIAANGSFVQRLRRWFYDKRWYFAAFFLPVTIMFIAYAVFKVYPFGDNSALVLDLNGQYVYYYEAYRDAFWGDGSFIYDWSRNLSGEMFGIFAYYLATFISCAVFALINGAGLSLNVTYECLQVQFGYNSIFVSQRDFLIISVIVPMAVTIGISLVQLLLSFVFSPVTSFALTCMVYVLSAYYTVWFLPGSFTMWLRSSYFDEKGLNPLSGIIIAAFLIITVSLLGKDYFEKKDII